MADELIKIKEDKHPRLKCPHCSQVINLDLSPWQQDITRIMQDKCYKCHGTICVSLIMVAHVDIHKLAVTLDAMFDAVGDKNKLRG